MIRLLLISPLVFWVAVLTVLAPLAILLYNYLMRRQP